VDAIPLVKRILIVSDDWSVLRAFARMYISDDAYQVELSPAVNDAALLLSIERYDVLVADASLPVERLVQAAARRGMAAIALVGGDLRADVLLQMFAAGASDFLSRPLRISEKITSRIEEACEHSEPSRRLREYVRIAAREISVLARAQPDERDAAYRLLELRLDERHNFGPSGESTAALALELGEIRDGLSLAATIENTAHYDM
jgi:DNA-binding NtrC family response regulator